MGRASGAPAKIAFIRVKKESKPKAAYSFPRSSRLLKHAGFEQVYNGGRRHFSISLTAFYVLKLASSPESAGAKVGLTVSRALGGAVDRNRMKRRMRNLVRVHLVELNAILQERGLAAEIVINPKKTSLTADHAKLSAEVARAFAVIGAASLAQAKTEPKA